MRPGCYNHCVLSLDKTLYTHSVSLPLHPGGKKSTSYYYQLQWGGGGGGGGRKEWRGVEGRDRSLTCNELPTSNILLARDTRISSGSMGRAVNKFES